MCLIHIIFLSIDFYYFFVCKQYTKFFPPYHAVICLGLLSTFGKWLGLIMGPFGRDSESKTIDVVQKQIYLRFGCF